MLTYKGSKPSNETTLNDIPVGTIFEGTITAPLSQHVHSGIFLRVNEKGSWYDHEHKVFAIGLTVSHRSNPHHPWIIGGCLPVKDYRVLKNPEIVERG